VRIRSKKGVENLGDLSPTLTLGEFYKVITNKTGYTAFKLLSGYPPRPLTADSSTPISSVFSKGETINVEEDTTTAHTTSTPNHTTTNVHTPQQTQQDTSKPVVQNDSVLFSGSDEEGFMTRRKIADDNSCLFNAVGYVLEGKSRSKAPQLRSLIASLVVADSDTYSDAVLGKPCDEYATWILNSKNWGGAIELSVLSNHYQAEIAAFDVSTKKMYCYGEGEGYSQRVYLIYDGIHYDAVALNPIEDGPEDFDVTVFSPYDESPRLKTAALIEKLHKSHQYTDTARFQLLCLDCNTVLTGEKEAALHAASTSHTNFVEKK